MRKIKNWMIAAILVCGFQGATAQTLRGVVTDAISGEPLIGATVKLVEAEKGAVTDIDGNYRISVGQSGRFTIETSCRTRLLTPSASTSPHASCATTSRVSHCPTSSTAWTSKDMVGFVVRPTTRTYQGEHSIHKGARPHSFSVNNGAVAPLPSMRITAQPLPSPQGERLREGELRSGMRCPKGGVGSVTFFSANNGAAAPLPSRGGVPEGRGGVCTFFSASKKLQTPPLPLPLRGGERLRTLFQSSSGGERLRTLFQSFRGGVPEGRGGVCYFTTTFVPLTI